MCVCVCGGERRGGGGGGVYLKPQDSSLDVEERQPPVLSSQTRVSDLSFYHPGECQKVKGTHAGRGRWWMGGVLKRRLCARAQKEDMALLVISIHVHLLLAGESVPSLNSEARVRDFRKLIF